MQHEFSDRFDGFDDADVKASAERFEEMLKSKETIFFDEETYEQLSEYYLLKSKWDMAMKACRIGLQQYPYSLELLLDKVQLHANYEQFDEAMEVLDTAAIYNPADNEITYMRGVICNLMGNYEDAVDHLREALLLSDEKETVYFQLAQTYQNWQKFEEAAHFYKKAIRNKFQEEIAFYELVFCLEQANKLEENLSYFQELVDNDPYSHFAWFALGMTHSRLGKHKDAAFAYDYAVTVKEDFASGWFNLAHAYMNLNNFIDAKECYANVLKHEAPTAEVYTHLGAACEKLEQYDEAYKNYREATVLDDNWDDAWFGMGSALYEQERWFESVHFTQKAIKLNEENADYWLLLGDTESKLGNFLSSNEAYTQAVALDSNNPDIWLNWSLLFFEQSQYSKAFEIVYDGISEMPDDSDLFYRAAAYLIFDGSYNEAYKYLETGLILNYDAHAQIYDFFPNLDTQKALFRIIEQYK